MPHQSTQEPHRERVKKGRRKTREAEHERPKQHMAPATPPDHVQPVEGARNPDEDQAEQRTAAPEHDVERGEERAPDVPDDVDIPAEARRMDINDRTR